MSKREKRKREKRRRSSAPTRTRVILATWSEGGPPILEVSARRAYEHLRSRRFATTAYHPCGPDRRCYVNVEQQIERYGGEAVTGWAVLANNAPRLNAGKNKYAKYSLEAHAVWRVDDALVEVTDGGHVPFIPDADVEFLTNGSLFFCDNETCAARILAGSIPGCATPCHLIVPT